MILLIFFISLFTAALIVVPLGLVWQFQRKQIRNLIIVDFFVTGIFLNIISNLAGSASTFGIVLVSFFMNGGLTFGILVFMFFRDPERESPDRHDVILSPADGHVIYVKKIVRDEIPISEKKQRTMKLSEFAKTEVLSEGAYLVGIGMSVMNVHVNRAPIAGKIELIKHKPGKFLSLKREDALSENERVTTIIDNDFFKIGVIQIASRLVRRIVSYVREQESVTSGQRIGMIKFGSQVDVLIPKMDFLMLNVKPGDEVKAGASILATYKLKPNMNVKLENMVAEECSLI